MKKIISIITLAAFVTTSCYVDISQAQAAYSPKLAAKSPQKLDVTSFSLPEYLGQIKDLFQGTSEKTIIHIQDAHCNYACQKGISEIINYINKEHEIDTINLEGGAGEYDISIFTRIKDRKIRKKVSDYFVEEGLVNGAEYYAINNPDKSDLWGVEDVGLYLKNLNVYKNSLKHKDELDKYMKSLNHIINNLKRHIFNKELLEVSIKYTGYKEGNIEFKDYLNFLIEKAKLKFLNIKDYPNIYLINQSLEQEKSIDFRRADAERSYLIDDFENTLSKLDFEKIVKKSIEFKTKKVSQKGYYSYLFKKAKEYDMDLTKYPQLQKYLEYISTYESVEKAKIIVEMNELENNLKETLFENNSQRKLDVLSKNLVLIGNLFNLKMSKQDWDYYCRHKTEFGIQNFTNFISQEAGKYKITTKPDGEIGRIDEWREKMEDFFTYSFARDEAFLNNLKTGGKNQLTILMTGGFHTENLLHLLEDNEISYISIIPQFRNPADYESPYFKLLSGDMSNTIKALTTDMSSIALWSDWCVASMNKGVSSDMRRDALKSLVNIATSGECVVPVGGSEYRVYKIFDNKPSAGDGWVKIENAKVYGKQIYVRDTGDGVDKTVLAPTGEPAKDTIPGWVRRNYGDMTDEKLEKEIQKAIKEGNLDLADMLIALLLEKRAKNSGYGVDISNMTPEEVWNLILDAWAKGDWDLVIALINKLLASGKYISQRLLALLFSRLFAAEVRAFLDKYGPLVRHGDPTPPRDPVDKYYNMVIKPAGDGSSAWLSLFLKIFLMNISSKISGKEPAYCREYRPIKEEKTTFSKNAELDGRKVVAIGDIHGNFKGLLKILEGAKLIRPGRIEQGEPEWVWCGGNRVLVNPGDIMDRGRDSDADRARKLLIDLKKQAREQGGDVIRLLGNHDLAHMQGMALNQNNFNNIRFWRHRGKQDLENGAVQAAVVVNDRIWIHGLLDPVMEHILRKEIAVEEKMSIEDITKEMIADRINRLVEHAVVNNNFNHPIFGREGVFWKRLRQVKDPDNFMSQGVGHDVVYSVRALGGHKILGVDLGMIRGNLGWAELGPDGAIYKCKVKKGQVKRQKINEQGKSDIGISSDGEGGFTRKEHEEYHDRGEFAAVIESIANELGATDLPKVKVGNELFYDLRQAAKNHMGQKNVSVITLHDNDGLECGEIRIEDDGMLVIKDKRFRKDHAGRGQMAVYGRDEAKIQHELSELRAWVRFAVSERIIESMGTAIENGDLGLKLRNWMNAPSIDEDTSAERRQTIKNNAVSFHDEAIEAEFQYVIGKEIGRRTEYQNEHIEEMEDDKKNPYIKETIGAKIKSIISGIQMEQIDTFEYIYDIDGNTKMYRMVTRENKGAICCINAKSNELIFFAVSIEEDVNRKNEDMRIRSRPRYAIVPVDALRKEEYGLREAVNTYVRKNGEKARDERSHYKHRTLLSMVNPFLPKEKLLDLYKTNKLFRYMLNRAPDPSSRDSILPFSAVTSFDLISFFPLTVPALAAAEWDFGLWIELNQILQENELSRLFAHEIAHEQTPFLDEEKINHTLTVFEEVRDHLCSVYPIYSKTKPRIVAMECLAYTMGALSQRERYVAVGDEKDVEISITEEMIAVLIEFGLLENAFSLEEALGEVSGVKEETSEMDFIIDSKSDPSTEDVIRVVHLTTLDRLPKILEHGFFQTYAEGTFMEYSEDISYPAQQRKDPVELVFYVPKNLLAEVRGGQRYGGQAYGLSRESEMVSREDVVKALGAEAASQFVGNQFHRLPPHLIDIDKTIARTRRRVEMEDLSEDAYQRFSTLIEQKSRIPVISGEQLVYQKNLGGGASGARLVLDKRDGKQKALKFGANDGHTRNEVLANFLYAAVGADVPQAELVNINGRLALLTEYVEGEKITHEEMASSPGMIEGFVIDAWLANWDVANNRQNVISTVDGRIYRVDNGGAMEYHGAGDLKGSRWGSDVIEIQSLRKPLEQFRNRKFKAHIVFGHLTDSDVAVQIRNLMKNMTPEKIGKALEQAGYTGEDKVRLQSMLEARLASMGAWAAGIDSETDAESVFNSFEIVTTPGTSKHNHVQKMIPLFERIKRLQDRKNTDPETQRMLGVIATQIKQIIDVSDDNITNMAFANGFINLLSIISDNRDVPGMRLIYNQLQIAIENISEGKVVDGLIVKESDATRAGVEDADRTDIEIEKISKAFQINDATNAEEAISMFSLFTKRLIAEVVKRENVSSQAGLSKGLEILDKKLDRMINADNPEELGNYFNDMFKSASLFDGDARQVYEQSLNSLESFLKRSAGIAFVHIADGMSIDDAIDIPGMGDGIALAEIIQVIVGAEGDMSRVSEVISMPYVANGELKMGRVVVGYNAPEMSPIGTADGGAVAMLTDKGIELRDDLVMSSELESWNTSHERLHQWLNLNTDLSREVKEVVAIILAFKGAKLDREGHLQALLTAFDSRFTDIPQNTTDIDLINGVIGYLSDTRPGYAGILKGKGAEIRSAIVAVELEDAKGSIGVVVKDLSDMIQSKLITGQESFRESDYIKIVDIFSRKLVKVDGSIVGIEVIKELLSDIEKAKISKQGKAVLQMAVRAVFVIRSLASQKKTSEDVVVQYEHLDAASEATKGMRENNRTLRKRGYANGDRNIVVSDDVNTFEAMLERANNALKSRGEDARAILLMPQGKQPENLTEILAANPRIRVKIIEEEGNYPDIMTKFGLGLELLDFGRDRERDLSAVPSSTLMGILASITDADLSDPEFIENLLKADIALKITKINFENMQESMDAIEMVNVSL